MPLCQPSQIAGGWGFPGENKAWEGPREERESSASGSKAWEGVAGESTGGKGLAGASEAWKGPQVEKESFAGENKA
jgi:hypothetical protein